MSTSSFPFGAETIDARAEVILFESQKLPKEERRAFLDQQCGSDAALRAEVEALLEAHDRGGSLLGLASGSPGLEAGLARLKPEEAGETIGPYKLLQQIGEGGFGVVWMAEQQHPIRRVILAQGESSNYEPVLNEMGKLFGATRSPNANLTRAWLSLLQPQPELSQEEVAKWIEHAQSMNDDGAREFLLLATRSSGAHTARLQRSRDFQEVSLHRLNDRATEIQASSRRVSPHNPRT